MLVKTINTTRAPCACKLFLFVCTTWQTNRLDLYIVSSTMPVDIFTKQNLLHLKFRLTILTGSNHILGYTWNLPHLLTF
jgi:hypothetical protein